MSFRFSTWLFTALTGGSRHHENVPVRGPRWLMSLVFMVLVFASDGTPLEGQTAITLEPGQRVRVKRLTPSGSYDRGVKGTIMTVTNDTLFVVQPEDASSPIHVTATDYRIRLEVFTGRRRSTTLGGGVGFFLGAATGAILGLSAAEQCQQPNDVNEPGCITGGAQSLEGGLKGAGIGIVAGAIVGALIKRDIWTRPAGYQVVRPVFSARRAATIGLAIPF